MNKPIKIILVIILAVAVIFRLAAAIYLGDVVVELPGTADQLSYHNLALRLLDGHGFSFGEPWWPLTRANAPTAHWSYLYTFYVTGIYGIFGPHPLAARLIQAFLVGVLHPLLIFMIGRRIFNPWAGLIAAGLAAIYPYFVYYSAALMTEPFYFVAILLSLILAILLGERLAQISQTFAGNEDLPRKDPAPTLRWNVLLLSIALGASLSAAVLLRQLFLLFIPLLVGWLWLANHRRINGALIASIVIIGVVVIASILPFTLYNYARFQRFVMLNTNAGFAFFWGNHPIYGTHFIPILPAEMGNYRDLIPKELAHLDEAALDQALLKEAVGFILDDPGRYVLLSISRIPAYFMFWPSPASDLISNISRVGGFGMLLPFMIYGLFRALMPGRYSTRFSLGGPLGLLVIFSLFYTGIHLLTWALIRYRLPVDSILILLAGFGMYDLAQRIIGRREINGHRLIQPAKADSVKNNS